ncbi:MAG: hypothetical protein GC171_03195 [Terrimonas sp.]|nr:hypothetical protein [Terrimonas sp.]
MKNAEAILLVKFNSSLSPGALITACREQLDDFRNVPGLIQKYYITEEDSGVVSGFYIFENKTARANFWASELAKNIPALYSIKAYTLRVEQYKKPIALNDELLVRPKRFIRPDKMGKPNDQKETIMTRVMN